MTETIGLQHLEQLIQRVRGGDITLDDFLAFLEKPHLWRGLTEPMKDYYQIRLAQMMVSLHDMGLTTDIPPVPRLTKKQRDALETYGFGLYYLVVGTPHGSLWPGVFDKVDADKLQMLPVGTGWVAIETAPSGGPMGHGEDDLVANIISGNGVRTGRSADEIEARLPNLAREMGFPQRCVRLPGAEESSAIARIMVDRNDRSRHNPTDGDTYAVFPRPVWEWCFNRYGDGMRAVIGKDGNDNMDACPLRHPVMLACVSYRVLIDLSRLER